ncbi:hypothetical protein SAMN05878443_0908 [Carnobacterium alterfunditum]|uniref:Nudix hydrolase domain-containing protein n=1 Tax=Carnobacterium alterfunditum TaxID=28230 RepID=A0A1N6FZ36_9LACT|nr:hypothetical protein [Carnobacterium alterfunditum]SIO00513.1 hypothetical protein SAMN05878443_0908 [Carnobacterium alterfunditum]
MTEKRWVAGTIMAKDPEGKYVFLVKKETDMDFFTATEINSAKTGLASIIDKLKTVLPIEASDLKLYELTNAIVNDDRIPLFVFEFLNEEVNYRLLTENNDRSLFWLDSDELTKTLERWEISGVPQFK